MADKVDVLICGSGSAGLCAAVWLARAGVSFKIIERRDGPLVHGQADGVQCRTVEVMESFGLSEAVLREAYHVLEVAFWSSDPSGRMRRSHFAADTEPGLSHQPHVILNQGRINGLLTEDILRHTQTSPIEYACQVTSVSVDSDTASDPDAHCVTVEAVLNGSKQVYNAKYVLGCDGAHSVVRKSLGFSMVGDSTNAVWGVVDLHPRTNFPDIRKKAILNQGSGNLMIIPREGDSLVRFYIELPDARASEVTLESLEQRAKDVFAPYDMSFAETVWWSAYSIGQRLADGFHRNHRVFLTGDACHTHSPKAGQGMNVSLQDGYNMGWKLASVLRGRASPLILQTYVSERQGVAADLIDFDRRFTKLFSTSYRKEHGISDQQFQEYFVQAGRYMAGVAVSYKDSLLVASSPEDKALATKLTSGMRFPSAQVVRYSDARAMQLVRALPADGRWHLLVFGGNADQSSTISRLAEVSGRLSTIVDRLTSPAAETDSIINSLLVLSGNRKAFDHAQVPPLFEPETGRLRLKCPHRVFFDDASYNSGHGHAYQSYGISSEHGALVLVRPDHYVAKIAPLEETEAIQAFFESFARTVAVNGS